MLRAVSLAFSSLSDRRILLVLAKVIALTVGAFVILGVALWFAIDAVISRYFPNDDGTLGAAAVLIIFAFAGWVLFRSLAIAFTWVFADDVIDAVEDRHYPFAAALGQRPTFAASARMAVRSIGRVVGYNLLLIPIYALLLVSGVGTPLAFLVVNGYLIGRDLEDMLVARHGSMYGQIGAIRRFLLGLGSVAAMLIPLFQFLVPVLATAAVVHVAHDKTGKM